MAFANPVNVQPRLRSSATFSDHVFMVGDAMASHNYCQRFPILAINNHHGMTVGERIREARAARDMTRDDLSRRSGVKYPTLAGLENGDQRSSTMLPALAAALRVSVNWLADGRGAMDVQDAAGDAADWADITGYAQAAGLGDGVEAQEYAVTHKLKFRADSLSRKRLHPGKLAVLYGKGDSMLPRIRTGDAILFDISDTNPRDECLFVILCQGVNGSEYSVKQCAEFGGDVFFQALNPEGDHGWRKPRRMADARHPITIIGRVRWIGSWED